MKNNTKVTSFGKFLRKLRIEKGEILKTMADNLAVSVSLLSAVENGNRGIPENWTKILREKYHLDEKQYQELIKAMEESIREIKIKLDEKTTLDRNLVIAFAREVSSLTEDDKAKILDLLGRKND